MSTSQQKKAPLPALTGQRTRQRKKHIPTVLDPEGFVRDVNEFFVSKDFDISPAVAEELIGEPTFDNTKRPLIDHAQFFFNYLLFGNRNFAAIKTKLPEELTPRRYALTCPDEEVILFVQFIAALCQRKSKLKTRIPDFFTGVIGSLISLDESSSTAILRIAHITTCFIKEGLMAVDVLRELTVTTSTAVESGLAQTVLIAVIKNYAAMTTERRAIAMLKTGGFIKTLRKYIPFTQRENFNQIMEDNGIGFVAVETQRTYDAKVRKEAISVISKALSESGPAEAHKKHAESVEALSLDEEDAALLLWDAMATSLPATKQELVKSLEAWASMLTGFTMDKPVIQGKLIMAVQSSCYSEPKLLNYFGSIVQLFYHHEVLDEDVIVAWNRVSSGKGASVFKGQLSGLLRWFDQAEEEPEEAEE
ncbi:eIF4-gamma/eIF5/eIF2-epsilon [Carpediemonas membranifera]|uniref:eIF4-gamma/eIF5/eIF2-epsilon n=1 Tax=Carpediemonas membranifera TaxID=201153 RepID=A0A8J6B7G2_9EUKA|nr:eIF4-gamma/eIF5/eIF2-epsilon [Carpediemonas membranifera]|eukprot:KAG9395839.1 eIF4-gamma/eIF5/eIF2-epsilon [Carpediemonas membranifera]